MESSSANGESAVDRPPRDFSPIALNTDEAESAGRYACCESEVDLAYPRHAYDGINFWTLVALEHRRQAVAAQVPRAGGHHKGGCRCELCGRKRGEPEGLGQDERGGQGQLPYRVAPAVAALSPAAACLNWTGWTN